MGLFRGGICILTLLIATTVKAGAEDVSEFCNVAADHHGEPRYSYPLNIDCRDWGLESSTAFAKQTSHVRKFKAWGSGKFMVIQSLTNAENYDFIAGKNTGLEKVIAIDLNDTKKEIWALQINKEDKKEIRVFTSKYAGNLKPLSIYKDAIYPTATALKVNEDGKRLAIVSANQKQIHLYQVTANSLKESSLIKVDPKVQRITAILWSGAKLLVLDGDQNKVFEFSTNAPETLSADRTYSFPILSSTARATSLYFHPKLNQTIIQLSDGTRSPMSDDKGQWTSNP